MIPPSHFDPPIIIIIIVMYFMGFWIKSGQAHSQLQCAGAVCTVALQYHSNHNTLSTVNMVSVHFSCCAPMCLAS